MEKMKAFLVPDEYLKEIKGGGQEVQGEKYIECPACRTGAPIVVVTPTDDNTPTKYFCKGCGCAWLIRMIGGKYYIEILG